MPAAPANVTAVDAGAVRDSAGASGYRGGLDLGLSRQAQPAAFDALTKAVVDQAVSHAWLLVGPSGVGQREAARYLGAALNCEVHGGIAAPCLACTTCLQALHGVHTAVRDFVPTGTEHRVADVREQWLPMATTTSIGGARKVLRIVRADRMNEQAQNAFLKVLEEPPASTVWMLDAAEDAALLDTIVSRCRRLDLRPWSQPLLRGLLDRWCVAGDGDPGVGSGDEPSAAALTVAAGRSRSAPTISHVASPGDTERAALVRLAKGSPDVLRDLSTCATRELRRQVVGTATDLALFAPADAGGETTPRVSELLAAVQESVLRVQLANKAELFELGVMLGVHDRDGKKIRGGQFPPGLEKREKQRHARLERDAQTGGIRLILDLLAAWVRDLLALGAGSGAVGAGSRGDDALNHLDAADDLRRIARGIPSALGLIEVLAAIEEAHRGLEQNGSPKLMLERPLLRLVMALHVA